MEITEDNGEFIYKSEFYTEETRDKNNCGTLLELMNYNALVTPNRPFLGTIVNESVKYVTCKEFSDKFQTLSAFLQTITTTKDVIGIYSVNRMEWLMAEYASYAAGCLNVPLYSTFTPRSLTHVLEETEMRVIIVSEQKALTLYHEVLSKAENIKIEQIILMDDSQEVTDLFTQLGITTYLLKDILNQKYNFEERAPPTPDSVATICYTSGTSGDYPKGVILTHKNLMAVVAGFQNANGGQYYIEFKKDDVYISYLPLAHVLERVLLLLVFSNGAKACFFRGKTDLLLRDFNIIKPTILAAVPRVLDKFKVGVLDKINSRNTIVRFLFKTGLFIKKKLQRFGIFKNYILDPIIFRKISKEFGGQIRAGLVGGAACSADTLQFIQAIFSCSILQGYGQTEGAGGNIVRPEKVYDFETVGLPFGGTMIKLKKEEYFPDDVGQILMKGPSITKGYFRNDKANKDSFEDGWIKTGDMAKIVDNKLFIVDRIKDIFKTSFGEYIAPSNIEFILSGDPIEDIVITNIGKTEKLAVIVEYIGNVYTNEEIENLIIKRAKAAVSEKRMKYYEIPQRVIVVNEKFAEINPDLISSTFKCRRLVFRSVFADQLKE